MKELPLRAMKSLQLLISLMLMARMIQLMTLLSTTNCDGNDQLMFQVITNSNLSIAENGTGEYSLNGTDKELNEIRESMGDSFRMQGFYSSEIAVETNHPIPI